MLNPKVQAQVGDEYSELKISLEHFQRKLRLVIVKANRKRCSAMHQLTIHDMVK